MLGDGTAYMGRARAAQEQGRTATSALAPRARRAWLTRLAGDPGRRRPDPLRPLGRGPVGRPDSRVRRCRRAAHRRRRHRRRPPGPTRRGCGSATASASCARTGSSRHDAIGYVAYADLFAGDLQGIREAHRLPDATWASRTCTSCRCSRPGRAPTTAATPSWTTGPCGRTSAPWRISPTLAADLHAAGISLTLDLVLNHVAREHAVGRAREGRRCAATATTSTCSPTARCPTRTRRRCPRSSRRSRPATSPGTTRWTAGSGRRSTSGSGTSTGRTPTCSPSSPTSSASSRTRASTASGSTRSPSLWKRMGTNCQNQPEVHAITQALRACARIMAPPSSSRPRPSSARRTSSPYLGPGRPRRQGLRPRVPQLAHGPDLVGARRSRRTPAGHGALAVRPHPGRRPPGHLPAVPRRHRLGDRRRRRRRRRLERLRAPGVPRRLLRRRVPRQLRHAACTSSPTRRPATGARPAAPRASPASSRPSTSASPGALDLAIDRLTCAYAMVFGFGGLPLLYMGDELGMLNDQSYLDDPAKTRRQPLDPPTRHGLVGRRAPRRGGRCRRPRVRGDHRAHPGTPSLPALHASVSTEAFTTENPAVLVFRRRHAAGSIVQVYNLSELAQAVSTSSCGRSRGSRCTSTCPTARWCRRRSRPCSRPTPPGG